MFDAISVNDVAQAIELSVAPVFLLAGVSGLLNVLTSRLNRAVDRYRFLNGIESHDLHVSSKKEITIQIQRTHLIHWAIVFCTVCALLICFVVALLFLGTEIGGNFSTMIVFLFISAMVSLIIALIYFLREIGLALQLLKSFPSGRGTTD